MNAMDNRKLSVLMMLILALSFCCPSFSAYANAKKQKLLRYQTIYYDFYRKDDFSALVNLTEGIENDRIPEHPFSNNLLLAELFRMYGLDQLSEKQLLGLERSSFDKVKKSIIWFQLAKLYSEQGKLDDMATALNQFDEELPENLQDEANYLRSTYWLDRKRPEKAEKILKDIDNESIWYLYLKFNLGVVALQLDDDDGTDYLDDVGTHHYESEELLSLRDKSNITLAYYYLRKEEPDDAIEALERVRLDSRFANKALLGLGWAHSANNSFKNALVPWLTLSEKDPMKATVQEAKLAVPFAYSSLGANKQAVEEYEKAIVEFENISAQVQQAIRKTLNSNIFALLVGNMALDDYTITRNLEVQSTRPEFRLVIELLNQKKFQELLNQYKDLQQLKNALPIWRNKLVQMSATSNMMRASVEKSFKRFSTAKKVSAKKELEDARQLANNYEDEFMSLRHKLRVQNKHVQVMSEKLELKIRGEVLKALETKRQTIAMYLSQARFALAELLDNSNKNNGKK